MGDFAQFKLYLSTRFLAMTVLAVAGPERVRVRAAHLLTPADSQPQVRLVLPAQCYEVADAHGGREWLTGQGAQVQRPAATDLAHFTGRRGPDDEVIDITWAGGQYVKMMDLSLDVAGGRDGFDLTVVLHPSAFTLMREGG